MRTMMFLALAAGALTLGGIAPQYAQAADMGVPEAQAPVPPPAYGPPPPAVGYAYPAPPPAYYPPPVAYYGYGPAVWPGPYYYGRFGYWRGGYGPRFAYGYGRWGHGWRR